MEAEIIMADNDNKDDNDNEGMSPQADQHRRLDHMSIIQNMPPEDPRDHRPAQDRQAGRLTLQEKKRLDLCEKDIERALISCFKAGEALKIIRNQRLYRDLRNERGEKYQNFKAYCDGRWSFGASRARQLIAGHEVFEDIKTVTGVTLPRNEGVIRSIVKLGPDDRRMVEIYPSHTGPGAGCTK